MTMAIHWINEVLDADKAQTEPLIVALRASTTIAEMERLETLQQ